MTDKDSADRNRRPPPNAPHTTGDLTIRNHRYPSGHTSNDLWSRLNAEHPPQTMNYEVIAQTTAEVQDLENAPPLSMAAYLVESDQMKLLTTISIYSERGAHPDQLRLLYMNAGALLVWRAMGRKPTLVGARHRPPQTALLMYGVPFSQ